MSTCFVHLVEDGVDNMNVTYTQQRPGFKPRKTADVATYRRECPASLNDYDVTMLKVLDRNPLLKTNTNFSNDSQLFQSASSMSTDSMINNQGYLGGFNIPSSEIKSTIKQYDQLTKRPREFYGANAKVGTFQEALQMFDPNTSADYYINTKNSSIAKPGFTSAMSQIFSQEENRLKNFYEIDRIKIDSHSNLRSNITNYNYVPSRTNVDYWKDFNLAKKYYYYANNQIPFQVGQTLFTFYNHNHLTLLANILFDLIFNNRDKLIISDNDLRYVANILVTSMKFNLNETDADVELVNNYLNTLFNFVKTHSSNSGDSANNFIMNYHSTEFPKLALAYERKYNINDYFYNIDNEYKIITNLGTEIATFSLDIDYQNNTFVINSKDEGYLTFVSEPRSIKKFLNLPDSISEVEDGIPLLNTGVVRVHNSKNINIKSAGLVPKNGLAFMKDKDYALRFEYNNLLRTHPDNKNSFKFKTKLGARTVYLNISNANTLILTANEGPSFRLQIVKCPTPPQPSHIYDLCNNVGGYPRKNYFAPDSNKLYRFIDREKLSRQYDLSNLPEHSLETLPIDQRDKIVIQSYWDELCFNGILPISDMIVNDPIFSKNYNEKGVALCGLDKWNKTVNERLNAIKSKFETEKNTIDNARKAFVEKQIIILAAHKENVESLKKQFADEIQALIDKNRKEIDAEISKYVKLIETQQATNLDLKNRLEQIQADKRAEFERKKTEHVEYMKKLINDNQKQLNDMIAIVNKQNSSGFTGEDIETINKKLDFIIEKLTKKNHSSYYYYAFLLFMILFIYVILVGKFNKLKGFVTNMFSNFLFTTF